MPPPPDKCSSDGCIPSYLQQSHSASTAISLLPFLLTFAIVASAAAQRLFPLLSGPPENPTSHFPKASQALSTRGKRLAIATFSSTIALAAVLAELILCEISNTLAPAARTLAGHVTVAALLLLLIVVTPLLQLTSLINAAGWRFFDRGHGRRRIAWLLALTSFSLWLLAFWWVGHGLQSRMHHIPLSPAAHTTASSSSSRHASLRDLCLERIGVIGISLMAVLSGFASVSSPWQQFVVRHRPITDEEIARKEAGLAATRDMLETTQARLRALQRKMSDAPREGFMSKVMGSIRGGSADTQECRTLQLELDGLHTMATALDSSRATLSARRALQLQARTPLGRCKAAAANLFAAYCLYRLLTTLYSTTARARLPSSSSSSDPINTLLALLAKHWDPQLDQAAWAQQMSFFLSGMLLFASGSQAQQTLHLLTRLAPRHGPPPHAHLAHLLAQVSAVYVICAVLLLAGRLPRERGTGLTGVLGGEMPMPPAAVQAWFDAWFVGAGAATLAMLLLGRVWRVWWEGRGEDGDEDGAEGELVELGKRA